MSLQNILTPYIQQAVQSLFDVSLEKVEFQATRKDFEGDITVVIFPLLKLIKGNPVEIGTKIGNYLTENVEVVSKFNVVAGFLNIVIADRFYTNQFLEIKQNDTFGYVPADENGNAVMVEYASPNTNKPLHLGHVRNVLLGYSVAQIIKAAGKKVYKTQVINDRGIHICKSMLAWEKFGNGETPESTGLKGDKLVGNYYVRFEQEFQNEFNAWIDSESSVEVNSNLSEFVKTDEFQKFLKEEFKNYELQGHVFGSDVDIDKEIFGKIHKKAIKSLYKNYYFNNYSLIGNEVQEMLRKWEAGDEKVVSLWKMMNGWVYEGFDVSYKNIGVDFDRNYYESDTYLLGKDVVEDGLAKDVFYKKEDGSVWIDLTSDGLDEKLVLRSDGTSVYMTQDIGTAIQRVKDFPDVDGMVYTVGNEQDYHFKVLFLILKKLGFDWAENLFHLSYGMVDLPSGKMKSREGTVVDADDLIADMKKTAREISEELGKLDGYSEAEKEELYRIIGLGALKYYILKVDPKKRILFDPKESVDFAGNTGPFIQYTYARIQSILRKADFDFNGNVEVSELHEKEKELLKIIAQFPDVVQQAAKAFSPALIANYTYDLVKEYNSFYQSVSILGEENQEKKIFRVQLSNKVAQTIKNAFQLLGIEVPNRM